VANISQESLKTLQRFVSGQRIDLSKLIGKDAPCADFDQLKLHRCSQESAANGAGEGSCMVSTRVGTSELFCDEPREDPDLSYAAQGGGTATAFELEATVSQR
jgi:hypothetical protein